MSQKRNKKYNPNSKYNPVVQAKKIENTRVELEKLKQTIELITESNEKHYQLLGNFARHDIKNIIINLNSILELFGEKIEDTIKDSIELNIESLSAVISNFSKLIPHSDNAKFHFNDLLIAVKILIKPLMSTSSISYSIIHDPNDMTEINLPFQAVLQMINNLVVNSIKALEDTIGEKTLEINAKIEHAKLIIKISDNGCDIADENINKVFEFAFSTTGGSGIGLNHAKFLCEKFNGNISLSLGEDGKSNKSFNVEIPI